MSPQNNYLFADIDRQAAAELVKSYSRSCGIGCCYQDKNGKSLLSEGFGCPDCGLCSFFSHTPEEDAACRSHQFGMSQSERFGGRYVYFCKMGFTFFSSPVIMTDHISGFLLGGPVLMVEPEDLFAYDMTGWDQLGPEQQQAVRVQVDKVPKVEPDRVSHLSHLLYVCAGFMGGAMAVSRLSVERESEQRVNQIGDYMQQLKGLQRDEGGSSYPFATERKLHNAIASGDKSVANQLLNEILGYIFFYSGGSFDVISNRVLELIILISRAAVEGGADDREIFDLNSRYTKEIQQFTNVEDLCGWLSGVMSRFLDCVFKFNDIKHVDIIYKAADYIRRNCSKKITLEDVAGYVYLSPAYFSRLFSEEMNCTFSTFLNQVRIEKSKRLLLSEEIRLVDIALLVGYEDQSYFSKVFKKLTGTTPGKYRELRGKIVESSSGEEHN